MPIVEKTSKSMNNFLYTVRDHDLLLILFLLNPRKRIEQGFGHNREVEAQAKM